MTARSRQAAARRAAEKPRRLRQSGMILIAAGQGNTCPISPANQVERQGCRGRTERWRTVRAVLRDQAVTKPRERQAKQSESTGLESHAGHMPLAPGFRLGPYEILSPLGTGGMGEVYRARDEQLHRDVAIKVLPERTTGRDEAVGRFEREARARSSGTTPATPTSAGGCCRSKPEPAGRRPRVPAPLVEALRFHREGSLPSLSNASDRLRRPLSEVVVARLL